MTSKKKTNNQQTLSAALAAINKNYGSGAAFRLGSTEGLPNIDVFSTGCLSLDKALGVGGIARGRITEIYGPESSGKTTIALHIVAEAQKRGEVAAFVDAEHALDPQYASNLGVDTDNLIVSQPSCGEEALSIVETLTATNEIGLIVVDSVAALVPRAELEGEMGQSHMGLQARLMSQAMRKLAGLTYKTNTTLIFINQIRHKMVMFGSPEVLPGGHALKFYASQRIDVRRTGSTTTGEEVTGNETRIKIVKNKVAPPFKVTQVVIRFGQGIDSSLDLLRLAVEREVIQRSGSWYSLDGDQLGQGEEKVSKVLKENHELYTRISKLCI